MDKPSEWCPECEDHPVWKDGECTVCGYDRAQAMAKSRKPVTLGTGRLGMLLAMATIAARVDQAPEPVRVVPAPPEFTPRPVVYVAGPYKAHSLGLDPRKATMINVDKARRVGALLDRAGYSPLVPHLLGAGGLYGRRTAADTREAALGNGLDLLRCVGLSGGGLAVILCPDGSMSEGTQREWAFWVNAYPESEPMVKTWTEWKAAGA